MGTSGSSPGAQTTVETSHHGFAMAFGGGLDFRISKGILLRPAQVDYVLTHVGDAGYASVTGRDRHQNNLRVSAGILLSFGSAR
jgi:hypothetical protein